MISSGDSKTDVELPKSRSDLELYETRQPTTNIANPEKPDFLKAKLNNKRLLPLVPLFAIPEIRGALLPRSRKGSRSGSPVTSNTAE
jgi:hypothetical protein